jgi:hypothetical protein
MSANTAIENGAKLWRAARLGQLPRVQRLLKHGADLGYRCDEHGTTALHQAVGNTRKDVVAALLEADASVDDEDNDGKTPLHYAESADLVEFLIAAGADVDHEDCEGKTPGRIALINQNEAVVEALISGRADRSKIYKPRKDTHRSRRVISDNQSTNEGPDLQHNDIRGAPDPSAKHEQNTGDNITTISTGLSDFHLRLTAGDNDRSSLVTPGDQIARRTPPQQHTMSLGRDELHGQLSAADGFPNSNTGGSEQALKLIIGIVSVC